MDLYPIPSVPAVESFLTEAGMHPDCIRILSSREHLLRPLLNPILMTRLLLVGHPEIRQLFSGCKSPVS